VTQPGSKGGYFQSLLLLFLERIKIFAWTYSTQGCVKVAQNVTFSGRPFFFFLELFRIPGFFVDSLRQLDYIKKEKIMEL